MVYVVRLSCHVYLDIYLDIHLNIHLDIYLDVYLDVNLNIHLNVYLDIHLNVYLDIHLNVYLILPLPHLTSTSPSRYTASRPPLHYLAPQSVSAIRVHSLVFPSSSTVNLRS